MSTLVIVESPAKSHTLKKFLGKDYTILPSIGHIRDLPEHGLGIKIDESATHFEPQYEISEDKKKIVAEIVAAAKKADTILLASDPDREGEAISWHLDTVLRERLGREYAKKAVRRVTYNEITKSAVLAGIAHPRDIDMNLVDAQQCRRVLDRLVGWRISRVLSRGIRSTGASAGRVQSPTLRLVCEREDAIAAFKPERYWEFAVLLRQAAPGSEPFTVRLRTLDGAKADIRDETAAANVRSFLENAAYTAEDPTSETKERRPGAPFSTSDLQQAASSALRFSPSRTMSLAQRLYEAGHITYMRTDHHGVSREAMGMARNFIEDTFGKEFSQPTAYQRHETGAQGAHEAIRPTDVSVTAAAIADPAEARLYDLIRTRFLTSQMKPARYRVDTLRVNAKSQVPSPKSGVLTASASTLLFPGFLAATPNREKALAPSDLPDARKGDGREEADDTIAALPPVAADERLQRESVLDTCKETKPPAHFTEASLVKAMEKEGIGRPSTYASILATLQERKYVDVKNRNVLPTPLGRRAVDFLVDGDHRAPAGNGLFYIQYTRDMERTLDAIAKAEPPEAPEDADEAAPVANVLSTDWQETLAGFYRKLQAWLGAIRTTAPSEIFRAVLEKFLSVREWEPPHKDGNRTYDDKRFVQEIACDYLGLERPRGKTAKDAPYSFDPSAEPAPSFSGTAPQLRYLLSILVRYRDQIPGIDAAFADALAALVPTDSPDAEALRTTVATALAPRDTSSDPAVEAAFKALDAAGVADNDRDFYESLRNQVRGGRPLNARQIPYLFRIFHRVGQTGGIPGYGPDLCKAAGIPWQEQADATVDAARAREVIDALAALPADKWEPPVTRKGRTYDDRAFFEDVAKGFRERGRIFPKALAALERMLARYKAALPAAAAVMEKYGIAEAKPRRASRSAETSPSAASQNVEASPSAPGPAPAPDPRADALLAFFDTVTEWHPKRGRFDDKKFVASIRSQHKRGKVLSEKQLAALEKMRDRYTANA